MESSDEFFVATAGAAAALAGLIIVAMAGKRRSDPRDPGQDVGGVPE